MRTQLRVTQIMCLRKMVTGNSDDSSSENEFMDIVYKAEILTDSSCIPMFLEPTSAEVMLNTMDFYYEGATVAEGRCLRRWIKEIAQQYICNNKNF